jgi:hypothetical protein
MAKGYKIITSILIISLLTGFSASQTQSLDSNREQVKEKMNEGLNLVIRGIQLVGFIVAVGQGSFASLQYQRSQGNPTKRDEALSTLKVSIVGAIGVVVIPEILKLLLAPYVIGWFLS